MQRDGDASGSRRDRGAQVVREVFGEQFLERTMGAVGPDDGSAPAAMARLALEQCYGDIWSRPGLGRRERSLVTLGILIAEGHLGELANHVSGARGNGITREELTEVALHAVPYVGFPAAGQAMQVMESAWSSSSE